MYFGKGRYFSRLLTASVFALASKPGESGGEALLRVCVEFIGYSLLYCVQPSLLSAHNCAITEIIGLYTTFCRGKSPCALC